MTSDKNGIEVLHLSERLLGEGKYHEAYTSAKKAMYLGLDHKCKAKAYAIAGEAVMMRSNKIRAIEIWAINNFKKSLRYDSGNAEVCHRIACLYAGMGNPEALEYFDRAIELDSANFEYWYNKAHSIIKLGRKIPYSYFKKADEGKVGAANIINFDIVITRITEAIKCMDRSIELCKASGDRLDIAVGYDTRGMMYEELSVFEKGVENLQKAKWDYVKASELSETFLGDLSRVKGKLDKYAFVEESVKK